MAWTYDTIKVGDKDSLTKKVTASMIESFADITDDNNPIHLNAEFAKTTPFGKRIAHGMLSASLISAVIGVKLPGNGCIYMSQSVRFKKPVFIDETLTAWAEVKEKIDEKKRLVLKTWVENQDGEVVVDGEALVLFNR